MNDVQPGVEVLEYRPLEQEEEEQNRPWEAAVEESLPWEVEEVRLQAVEVEEKEKEKG